MNLPNVCDDDPLDIMSCKAERLLDSPDSGLPPSPSPSSWLLPAVTGCTAEKGDRRSTGSEEDQPRASLLHPLSYGEGIALDPLPPKEMRYISSVHYDSKRHFIQDVALQPRGQSLEHCSQTVMTLPHSTWRRYKTQLVFQPRQRAQRFQSTTIVYPKHTQTVFTTELSYDCRRLAKRFLSSVELETAKCTNLPQ